MSDKIGPRAWGSQGMVFLGEDMMHTRDYSDETAHLIDEEVRVLLERAEALAIDTLTRHRAGLEAVAQALLARETISGTEVGELISATLEGTRDTSASPIEASRSGHTISAPGAQGSPWTSPPQG